MSVDSGFENRFLDASEVEMVGITRSAELEQQSAPQLKALTHPLRQAHNRAKDISTRQQREIRGKEGPRGDQARAGQRWLFGKSESSV